MSFHFFTLNLYFHRFREAFQPDHSYDISFEYSDYSFRCCHHAVDRSLEFCLLPMLFPLEDPIQKIQKQQWVIFVVYFNFISKLFSVSNFRSRCFYETNILTGINYRGIVEVFIEFFFRNNKQGQFWRIFFFFLFLFLEQFFCRFDKALFSAKLKFCF